MQSSDRFISWSVTCTIQLMSRTYLPLIQIYQVIFTHLGKRLIIKYSYMKGKSNKFSVEMKVKHAVHCRLSLTLKRLHACAREIELWKRRFHIQKIFFFLVSFLSFALLTKWKYNTSFQKNSSTLHNIIIFREIIIHWSKDSECQGHYLGGLNPVSR